MLMVSDFRAAARWRCFPVLSPLDLQSRWGLARLCANAKSRRLREKWGGLAEFRSAVWNGLFREFDGNAPPLDALYGDFGKCIGPWNTQDMEIAIAMEWECDFNWKVMIETGWNPIITWGT